VLLKGTSTPPRSSYLRRIILALLKLFTSYHISAPEVPQKGALEVTIASKSTRLGPGSVARVHSNEQHGWKNVGNAPAQYFMLAIRND